MTIIEQFNSDHGYSTGDVLFVSNLRESGFDDTAIEKVLSVLSVVCHYCFNNDVGCQCWNDD
jgi:hypothetical protein